jgi:hypothetical protein
MALVLYFTMLTACISACAEAHFCENSWRPGSCSSWPGVRSDPGTNVSRFRQEFFAAEAAGLHIGRSFFKSGSIVSFADSLFWKRRVSGQKTRFSLQNHRHNAILMISKPSGYNYRNFLSMFCGVSTWNLDFWGREWLRSDYFCVDLVKRFRVSVVSRSAQLRMSSSKFEENVDHSEQLEEHIWDAWYNLGWGVDTCRRERCVR